MFEVNVWADVRCPWCWIGSRRLHRAAAAADQRVRHRSYLLEPDGPPNPGKTIAEVAVREWGMSTAQWAARSRLIRAEGASEGLHINIDSALTFDSAPLHRLLKLAAKDGDDRAEAAWDAAFEAHFSRNENLADATVLTRLAAGWGLDASAAEQAVTGESFTGEVLADVDEARRLGVTSVPTVVTADSRRLAGSASVAELSEFLLVTGALR